MGSVSKDAAHILVGHGVWSVYWYPIIPHVANEARCWSLTFQYLVSFMGDVHLHKYVKNITVFDWLYIYIC